MSSSPRPTSLVAERAVRLLRDRGEAVGSVRLADEILATRAPDEPTARRLLETAFAGDRRLSYEDGAWRVAEPAVAAVHSQRRRREKPDPDRVLLFIIGEPQARSKPFRLRSVSALRLQGDDVVSACGGDATGGAYGRRLRRSMLDTLEGALPVVHDPPGGLQALERWLGQPLTSPLSVRKLARDRLGLPSRHSLEDLVARLGLPWRATEDPLEQADTLDACLRALRRPHESLLALRDESETGAVPIDWSRYAFDREFLREIPATPGTYRFFDAEGELIYVGKAKDLAARVQSYFRGDGGRRSERVQRLLARLHAITYEPSGSDLEAMLREARQIRDDRPTENVQRRIAPRSGRAARLRSILILEPAGSPHVLRAYLIREGRLLARQPIGPRGGGLRRIHRLLDDHYFSAPQGPTEPVEGPDLDVELVARWIATNRDRAVAFDPTDLPSSGEVIERLRWFLQQGGPFDGDGTPTHQR